MVMKKAEEQFSAKDKRLSIQLPSESSVQQSITNSFQHTPMKERIDSRFQFELPPPPENPPLYYHHSFMIV